jgi:hypothetical protein
MGATPDAIRQLLDELEANRRSRRTAWAPQRLRKFLEANGTRISIPDDRSFETEGEVIESGLRRTVEGRATVMQLGSSSLPVPRRCFGRREEGRFRQCASESLSRVGAGGEFDWTGLIFAGFLHVRSLEFLE